jgi:hypothetical protein
MCEPPKPTSEVLYQAYLVRLWRESTHSVWRATVTHILTGQQHHFDSLERLCLFLFTQANEETHDA